MKQLAGQFVEQICLLMTLFVIFNVGSTYCKRLSVLDVGTRQLHGNKT